MFVLREKTDGEDFYAADNKDELSAYDQAGSPPKYSLFSGNGAAHSLFMRNLSDPLSDPAVTGQQASPVHGVGPSSDPSTQSRSHGADHSLEHIEEQSGRIIPEYKRTYIMIQTHESNGVVTISNQQLWLNLVHHCILKFFPIYDTNVG